MTTNHNGKLRIVDRWGHTLFYFNCETNSVEIKAATRRGGQQSTKGELYAVNVEHLISVSAENQNSPEPVFVVIAKQADFHL